MTATLFVDLDGTIMRNPFWSAVFPIVSSHLAGQCGLPADAVRGMIVAENVERRALRMNAVLAQDWDDIAQTVARRLGVACDLSLEQIVIEHAQPPHTALLDGADDVLRHLVADGWQIVAATHGLTKYQLPVVRALGLLPIFSDMAAPDSRGCFKHERSFWLPYLDTCAPIVHVGDLYEDDVVPAKRFGIRSIWKAPAASVPAAQTDPFRRAQLVQLPAGKMIRPNAVIVHLSEVLAVLSTIKRG